MNSHKSLNSSKLTNSARKFSAPRTFSDRKSKYAKTEVPKLTLIYRQDHERESCDSTPISPTCITSRFRRFPLTPTTTCTKLGPGCYFKPKPKLGGPSFQFSLIDRFEADPIAKVALAIQKYHPRSIKHLDSKEKISISKDLTNYSLKNRIQDIKIKSFNLAERITKAKLKKEQLFNSAIETKRQKLQEKLNKYQIKKERAEIQKSKKSWVVMVSYIFSYQLAYQVYYRQKLIRIQTLKTQKFLYTICKCLGKFLRIRTLGKMRRTQLVRCK
jgi:hypothetical protein